MFDACVRVKARFIYATKGAFYLEKKNWERFFVSGNFVDFSFQTIITKSQKISNNYDERRDRTRLRTLHFSFLFILFTHTHTHTHTHHARVELNSRTPRARLRSERSLVSEREREIFLLEFFQCQTTTISLLLQSFSLR